MKAIWKGQVLAESDETIVVEGHHYFPPDSINENHFNPSMPHTTCVWKGQANYFNISVDDTVNRDAAWYYPRPKPAAENIQGYVTFGKGIEVIG